MLITRLAPPLLAAVLAAATTLAACGGSSPPPPTTPLPDDSAATAAPAEPAPAPAQPVEPPPPAAPPIAPAPPPAPPGAPRPHVAKALAFVPADAQIVVGLDVPRLVATPFGQKLVSAVLASDEIPAPCRSLRAAHFGNVVFGGGGGDGVFVADGKLAEKTMVNCVDAALKAKGGKLERKKIAGRTVRYASGSPEDNGWLAWTKGGVPLMATSEAAITAALDPKQPKVSGALAELAARADHARMLWGVMLLPAAQLAAMGLPVGSATGDVTVRGWVDLGTETELDVVIGFATPEEARSFDEQVRAMIAPMRGAPDLERILTNLQLGVHGNELHAILRLDAATTQQMFDGMKLN